jgi:hypothetical protein
MAVAIGFTFQACRRGPFPRDADTRASTSGTSAINVAHPSAVPRSGDTVAGGVRCGPDAMPSRGACGITNGSGDRPAQAIRRIPALSVAPALSALQEQATRRTLDAIVLKSSDQFLELIELPRRLVSRSHFVSFEFATASAMATLMIEVVEGRSAPSTAAHGTAVTARKWCRTSKREYQPANRGTRKSPIPVLHPDAFERSSWRERQGRSRCS